MKNKIKNFFYLDEEEEVIETTSNNQSYNQQEIAVANPKKSKNSEKENPFHVVSIQNAAMKNVKVIITEPRVYAEAQDIAEHIKNRRATIVNLQRIDRNQGIRIIDFLSGTVYALGGEIQRIGMDIFLCTPENVEVSGEISNFLSDEI